ncbi:DNRLRE domain-containing protein [Chondromyces crocatus]|uniref:DNRLRE domain-containing protein n=1 Tax=Chondromyces crocatus TaxID=52 RepID=A0A0K1E503_CHOCO|nr:DNRLRE domain-containing protein [Chondromyces crocatus]AKT35960.1 uncharacterized protein CMC5_000720 [Chondromyces crocatus]
MRSLSSTACLASLLALVALGCAASPDPPVCAGAGTCTPGYCMAGRCRPTTAPLAPPDTQRLMLQPEEIAVVSARGLVRPEPPLDLSPRPSTPAASGSSHQRGSTGARPAGSGATEGASTGKDATDLPSTRIAGADGDPTATSATATSATATSTTATGATATGATATGALGATATRVDPNRNAPTGATRLPEAIALGAASTGRTVLLFRFAATWPDNADITSAFLLLDPVEGAPPAAQDIPLEVARILDPWSADTVSWGRQPRLSIPGLAAVARRLPLSPVRIDVTDLVRAWAARARDDHGIALLASGDDPVGVACSLGITDGLGPRLEVYLR